ncbi:MAG: hypothetical protein ACTS80_00685 [Candidatus Hodgkinia cicadicola]
MSKPVFVSIWRAGAWRAFLKISMPARTELSEEVVERALAICRSAILSTETTPSAFASLVALRHLPLYLTFFRFNFSYTSNF